MSAPAWAERFAGGTREAEDALFRRYAAKMLGPPTEPDGRRPPRKLMFAKTLARISGAFLVIDRALPGDLAMAHFLAGSRIPAAVRFSSASAEPQDDSAPDARGVALRLHPPGGGIHDLLFANFPTALARDARQFFDFTLASQGEAETLLARLAARVGEGEARRMAAHLKASLTLCSSLARERYWGGSACLWGQAPVRFSLLPTVEDNDDASPPLGPDALSADFARRLASGDISFRFALQRYVDEGRTPIEDAAVDWTHRVAPPVAIATLVIPRQSLTKWRGGGPGEPAFNPWNAPAQFRPLGSLNRLRRIVYALASGSEQA